MTAKGLGMTAVVDEAGQLVGVFTDGDLRRSLDRGLDVRSLSVAEVMTPGGRRIGPDQLAVEALNLMEDNKISALLVVDEDGRLCGALNMHDLLRAGVV
jgi:arabinose-5-phosphate isomerase